MSKAFFKLTLVFFIFTSLFSCSITPDELEMLDKSVRSYERAIRWGDFILAKSFHKTNPTLHSIERRRLKLYKISGYTLLNHETPDLQNAYSLVEIKYYKNDRPVIKTLTVKQHWKREKNSKIWYIDTPFPNFR